VFDFELHAIIISGGEWMSPLQLTPLTRGIVGRRESRSGLNLQRKSSTDFCETNPGNSFALIAWWGWTGPFTGDATFHESLISRYRRLVNDFSAMDWTFCEREIAIDPSVT
jgi:hypothetical protein